MSYNKEPMRYRMTYEHCGETWVDEWSCACNSECPICHVDDIEPVEIEDLDMEPGTTCGCMSCPSGVHFEGEHVPCDEEAARYVKVEHEPGIGAGEEVAMCDACATYHETKPKA